MQHDNDHSYSDGPRVGNAPVLPLRDVVVYPHMVIPLFVGREKSIHALEKAMDADKKILLVAQKSAEVDEPAGTDIYNLGTLSNILQLLKLPDGTVKVLVEGAQRARIISLHEEEDFFAADISMVPQESEKNERELEVLVRSVLTLFDQYFINRDGFHFQ